MPGWHHWRYSGRTFQAFTQAAGLEGFTVKPGFIIVGAVKL
jgi:hypothetical protein